MNINELERLIQLALSPAEADSGRRAYASQVLDQLRLADDRWSVGLRLFTDAENDVARFFGLSLLRDWMQTVLMQHLAQDEAYAIATRSSIRSAIYGWIVQAISGNQGSIPVYILNNAISILTLSIKCDYPGVWPSAFSDVLRLGYSLGDPGVDFVTRVLRELEVEVVAFAEQRSRGEVVLGVRVKDAMRDSGTTRELLLFLGLAARQCSPQRPDLGASCLHCAAELIGWVDVQLVVQEVLPTVYEFWRGSTVPAVVQSAACSCMCELVRKGMDAAAKVHLLHSVQLIAAISENAIMSDLLAAPPPLSLSVDDMGKWKQLGHLLSLLVVELMGSWTAYEQDVVDALRAGGVADGDYAALTPIVVSSLDYVVPRLLSMLCVPAGSEVSSAVLPGCGRLVHLMRLQSQHRDELASLGRSGVVLFCAEQFLDPLLRGIYMQSQYPESCDGESGVEDEDDDDDLQARIEARKLFVNCCRVHPDRCLQLLTYALDQLPQPLSTAPFRPLEAVLRLVHAFSELGPLHSQAAVAGGPFPELVRFLQLTDAAEHSNTGVVAMFFEVSLRYLKYLDPAAVARLLQALLGRRGVQAATADQRVRDRAAYCVLKVVEGTNWKTVPFGADVRSLLSGILDAVAAASCSFPNTSSCSSQQMISEQAETYLCEAFVALTLSLQADYTTSLHHLITVQLNQIHQVDALYDRFAEEHSEQICVAIGQRIHALCGLCKGLSHRAHSEAMPYFATAAAAVVNVSRHLCKSSHSTMLLGRVLVFMHRMVACLGVEVVPLVQEVLPMLLLSGGTWDADDPVQLINQSMTEFHRECLSTVTLLFSDVVHYYYARLNALQSQWGHEPNSLEAPHVCLERSGLFRRYLFFIQHVVVYGCSAALYSIRSGAQLDAVLSLVLVGVTGAVPRDISLLDASDQNICGIVTASYGATAEATSINKAALIILHSLVANWLLPKPLRHEALPSEVEGKFRSFLFEQALPGAMQLVSGWTISGSQMQAVGRYRLNLKDAASQAVVQELSVLLFVSIAALGPQGNSYLEQLLCALHWPAEAALKVVRLLPPHSAATVHCFKDSFKRLVRDCAGLK